MHSPTFFEISSDSDSCAGWFIKYPDDNEIEGFGYSKDPRIDEIKNKATPVAKEFGIKSLKLFGSYAKGLNNENSDLDFIINKYYFIINNFYIFDSSYLNH